MSSASYSLEYSFAFAPEAWQNLSTLKQNLSKILYWYKIF